MSDTPTPEQVASFGRWASGLPADDSTTSTVVATLDEIDPAERQDAEVLALARHDASWRAGGLRHWRDLSAAERVTMTVEAVHWLRAARAIGLGVSDVRVSEIRPGQDWLLEGGWVRVVDVAPGPHLDDRVTIIYEQNGEHDSTREYRGVDRAAVRLGSAVPTGGAR